jgi:hypothetical protein
VSLFKLEHGGVNLLGKQEATSREAPNPGLNRTAPPRGTARLGPKALVMRE